MDFLIVYHCNVQPHELDSPSVMSVVSAKVMARIQEEPDVTLLPADIYALSTDGKLVLVKTLEFEDYN